ncbi:CgeB family protein [Mongoliimonas terrestris]|uniref:CgeB family protein n=1 Tax=Mongoliimonas terrestris TaxID=1709001 RepID=UPI0009497C5A|nr:glycosyltransferase [Mongoliimonas terrestris]
MTERPLDIVVLGLSLSSSWGNGHATTYRALLKGLDRLGHRVLFLERDVPWYREHRDLPDPAFCRLAFYDAVADLAAVHGEAIRRADAVIVGSYVPDGIAVIDQVRQIAEGPVGFYDIDTPVTLAALERGEDGYIARRQIPDLDVYFSFTGGPTLRRLESVFGARRAEALYCSAEETQYRPTGEPIRWDLGYLGTYSADRQPTLERLLIEPARRLPHLRFVVAGPQYPADIRWPANVERIDHLGPADHPSFYSRQRWTLNVTRADMIAAGWSPSVRLFEAGACGTPLVSDAWPGLTELLPDGEAIVIARSTDDVVALLGTPDEARRRRIAEAGRARVLAGHTGTARAEAFAAVLSDLRGPAAAPAPSARSRAFC